ncbi:MAG: penicillin-binding protein 1C [Anaerolineae bacterium]|nr:penicillin-binding protein 1C [Anaerolineae bacterium]
MWVMLGWGVLFTGLLVLGLVGYFYIAAQLPPPEELERRAFRFASSQIYDREGGLLWELIDPYGGRRTWVPLQRISRYAVAATIATEDRFFYAHVGVDPIAMIRALYYALSEGEVVSGGSTITQQLVRNVLLSPEERAQKTLRRKLREAVLAIEVARRYPKDKILEIYLNQIYYGNLAYGIEAAAQTYFGKSAADLNLAEAALLAGLPQAPATYDPIVYPERAKKRQQIVLGLMVEAGYVTQAEALAAYQQYLEYKPPPLQLRAPHFVIYVRQLLESRYGADALYHEPGLKVVTTLDPRIQAVAEEEVTRQIAALRHKDVSNGAAVVLNVKTGEILALVGSPDFYDERAAGQVNMALQPRQPGSAIKPLTYLAAFERGWTPATLIMDVPVEYPDGKGGVYRPVNYDGKFRGPVLVRIALANSLNIPAVKALEFVGIPALQEMARRLGITTLTRRDYGLALALGSGEVSLLELAGAYQAMANGGRRIPPVAVLRVTDGLGRLIEAYQPPPGEVVLRPEHAYLITHILADNEARTPLFGANSPLRLSRPAAAKTGTTNDFRDSWTIGYTPDVVVGVWVGNADNHPTRGLSGLDGAAPIWHAIMERILANTPIHDFVRPRGVIEMEICADSGTIPSPECPHRRRELFAYDQLPLGPEHDIHQRLRVDTRANCVVSHDHPLGEGIEERYYRVYPPEGRAWALEHGIEQPPPPCVSPDSEGMAIAAIHWPGDGHLIAGVVSIQGVALAAGFSHYVVEYGVGWSPETFVPLSAPRTQPVEGGVLAEWDTRPHPNGPYTLRVVVYDHYGGRYEGRSTVVVDNPLSEATPGWLWEEPSTPIPWPFEAFPPEPLEVTSTPEQPSVPVAPLFPPELPGVPQPDSHLTPSPEGDLSPWLWPEATVTPTPEDQMWFPIPEEPPVPWPTATPWPTDHSSVATP